MVLNHPTITAHDIHARKLIHDGPGIIGRHELDDGRIMLWQLRTTAAHAHWRARPHEPIRIIASCQYRSAVISDKKHEDTAYALLERAPWTHTGTHHHTIIATVLPTITHTRGHQTIELLGGYTQTRTHHLFERAPTCPTWKHAAATINQALARTNIINAHTHGAKPLRSTHYPELYFGTMKNFTAHALKHALEKNPLRPS